MSSHTEQLYAELEAIHVSTPKFQSTYQQSRLGPAITSRLPKTTSGPAVGLVLGVKVYAEYLAFAEDFDIADRILWSLPYLYATRHSHGSRWQPA